MLLTVENARQWIVMHVMKPLIQRIDIIDAKLLALGKPSYLTRCRTDTMEF